MATLKPIFEAAFEKHKYNCSGFVRETATALGIKIEGAQADNQLDFMEAHWIRLKNGIQAAEVASQGFFVVAGVKSTEYEPKRNHGHVVVIKPLSPDQLPVKKSSLYHGVYPRAWGGDIGRRYASQGDKSVGEIFNVAVRDKVRYYTPPVYGPQIQRYE